MRARAPAAVLRARGLTGIGTVLTQQHTETQAMHLIDDIAHEAQAAVMDSFVLGVPSTSVALSAVNAGIRYIEGKAVKAAVADPRHGFVQGVEELYSRLRASH